MTKKHKASIRIGAVAAALVLGMAVSATAQEGSIQGAKTPAAQSEKAKNLPSALAKALSRPAILATTQWADGTVAADLAGTYLNVWIAHVAPDGSLSHACVTSADQAVDALNGQSVVEVK